jgi:hypothetical protein
VWVCCCASAAALVIAALPVHATKGNAPSHISSDAAEIRFTNAITAFVYLPAVAKSYCGEAIPGASYASIAPTNPAVGADMELHPDVNLAMRGYELVNEYKGLLYNTGAGDPNAPQLYGLFSDNRTGTFSNVYAVHKWDWSTNSRGPVYQSPPVTLAGLAATPGETIHVPDSGYDIGGGNDVMVLYASATRLTLKYTREDDVIFGYTIHLENICVDPALLALYQSLNAAGRSMLPALPGGQALGRASGSEIGVVIRDTGAFMDPRSRNSWWIGR